MELGAHAATIWACYLSAAMVIGGLVIWLVADGRRLAADVARLEAMGVRRRSAATPAAPEGSQASGP